MAKFLKTVLGFFRPNQETKEEGFENEVDVEPGRLQETRVPHQENGKVRSPAKCRKTRLNWMICKRKSKKKVEKQRIPEPQAQEDKFELARVRHTNADVICPICLKFMCQAVTANCGHSYCDLCVNEYLLVAPVNLCEQDCLICGSKIRGKKMLARCKRLDNIIEQ